MAKSSFRRAPATRAEESGSVNTGVAPEAQTVALTVADPVGLSSGGTPTTKVPMKTTVAATVPTPAVGGNAPTRDPAQDRDKKQEAKGKGIEKVPKKSGQKRPLQRQGPEEDKNSKKPWGTEETLPTPVSAAIPPARDSSVASLRDFANCVFPGEAPLEPSSLRHSRAYTDFSLRGVETAAYINRLVRAYESDFQKDSRRIADARRDAVAMKTKLDEAEARMAAERKRADVQAKSFASDLELMNKKRREAEDKIRLLEMAVAKRDAHIASQQRRLDTEVSLGAAKAQKAVREARNELKDRMLRAAKMAADLLGDPQTSMSHLTQMEANLEMLELLKKGEISSIDAEIEQISAEMVKLVGADVGYDKIITDLSAVLQVSPLADEELAMFNTGEPLETEAAQVGVTDLSGSNHGTPGLPELNVNEQGESHAVNPEQALIAPGQSSASADQDAAKT